MSSMVHMDEIDKKILSYLMKNARIPFLEIARECGISGAAIHQRVKKLEEAGVIKGSKFIIKPKALGYEMCAFMGVYLEKANVYSDVISALQAIPEVVECHFITGNYALLLKIFCRDNEHLMNVLVNTIQNIPGIASTQTYISLEQTIERQVSLENDSHM